MKCVVVQIFEFKKVIKNSIISFSLHILVVKMKIIEQIIFYIKTNDLIKFLRIIFFRKSNLA